jgi:hypothetical protein
MQDGVTGFLTQPRDHVTMAEKLVVPAEGSGAARTHGRGRAGPGTRAFTVEKMVAGRARCMNG